MCIRDRYQRRVHGIISLGTQNSISNFQQSYMRLSLSAIFTYFASLTVAFHDINALYGFMIFLVIASQLVSGTMLSFSLVTEPMIIPIVRDEEDLEDLYTDDFF
eukprot:TRINITY_DN943_c0_g1_i6.p1 TRINITY_DN943_c0_g1~~TRINITY_DN943_c0_g1_i6.p1  ORF type:complete len:104 (+),score=1.53 TRINITY_DN943_c0_g1_i6:66-377(+)